MAEWLRMAGFDLRTHRADGTQYGFKAARDPETGQARIAGEIDGCIVGAPKEIDIPLPCLWESKKATHKKWTKFSKDGVAKADPKYHGQLQTNMAYLEVTATLFTMLDLDTMKIFVELVAFDPEVAQRLTDRAVQVLQSARPEEMPRVTGDPNDFRCKFCDWRERCWSAGDPAPAASGGKPPWLVSGPDVA